MHKTAVPKIDLRVSYRLATAKGNSGLLAVRHTVSTVTGRVMRNLLAHTHDKLGRLGAKLRGIFL